MSRSLRRSINTVFENSGENGLDSTGGSGSLLDENQRIKVTKRYHLFYELLETEANYVDVLNTIIEHFKKRMLESGLIGNRELHQIFGRNRFEELRNIHTHILSSLKQLDRRWTEKALVGQVFATAVGDFRRCYTPYFNQYDMMTSVLREMSNNVQINQLIQELEAGAREKKFKLTDLLVRPVQRLPSVNLLLDSLLKATSEKNPDWGWLEKAKMGIDTVLLESNDKRAEADQHTTTINVINQIDHFPAELVNSNRPFKAKADFRLLKGRGIFSSKRSEITFFLFSSCITVAKRRTQRQEQNGTPNSDCRMGTLSRTGTFNRSTNFQTPSLQRTPSILSMNFLKPKERKPYSHLEILRFSDIRKLEYLQEDGIFFVRIRDQMTEDVSAFQIAGDTNIQSAVAFFNEVCIALNNNSQRCLELIEVSDRLREAEEGLIEIDDDLELMTKAKQGALEVFNGAVRPTSTLRRTISSVSVSFYRKNSLNMSRASLISEQ